MARLRIFSAALMLLAGTSAAAQRIEGQWHGELGTAGRVALEIQRKADGTYVATMEAVDQSPERRLVDNVVLAGDRVSFQVPSVQGRFEGVWDAPTTSWSGQWRQRGGQAPLILKPGPPASLPVISGLDGSWDGSIPVGGAKLRVVLHVRSGPRGTLAKLDSPDQLAFGLPVEQLKRDGELVTFTLKGVGATFSGRRSADGAQLSGEWSQLGNKIPLTLTRKSPSTRATPRRPQTPVEPFPYREIEANFDNAKDAGVRLAGTLTVPQGPGPHPVAVLISGSGGQDRDSTIFGHKPFLVLADHLTRKGIAVLRVDDRGVAKSTGDRRHATSMDFAGDVAAAVAWLRARREIDPNQVGLIGLSEGGLIAPMVAADDRRIAFIVMLAGPAGRGDALWFQQQRAIALSTGATQAQLNSIDPVLRKVIDAVRDAPDETTARTRARAVLAALPKGERLPLGADDVSIDRLSTDWMRYFLKHDSTKILAEVRAPILALNGSKDVQVDAKENLAAIRAATSRNPDVTIKELAGLNHLFQTAPTGALGEYADIEETISLSALAVISDWLVARVKRSN